jgi:NADH-quinone oxidoreductase subunit N
MAYAFAFVMFSIAGIPPLAGFYSKLCVLSCLLAQQNVLITIIIAVFSSIACFYYVKLNKVSFFSVNESNLF